MKKRVIHTGDAPEAIGPYSQGIAVGDMIFAAGQIPLDPTTGRLVTGGIRDQAERVVENLRAVLAEAGSGLDRVVRLDVFLTDLNHFPAVNEYLASVFTDDPPARVTVEVTGLPLGAEIEMAAIAVR